VTEFDQGRLRRISVNLPVLNVVQIWLFTTLEHENGTIADSGDTLKEER
jgi:hypothetical protein